MIKMILEIIPTKGILYDKCENVEQLYDKYYYPLLVEFKQLQIKYNKVLTMLANYYPPCELDGFMDKNTEYCSINCGVDEEIFKECWDRYITQSLEDK